MPFVQQDSYKFGFSLNKQSVIGTPTADAAIDKLRPISDLNPITENQVAIVSDDDHVGKGNSDITLRETVGKIAEIPAQGRFLTDLEGLFTAAFVMGNVVSVQDDPVGSPNTWKHTITFQDQLTLPDPRYTTILEEFAGGTTPGYRKKLTGAWLNQFTLSGQLDQLALLSFQGQGRLYADEGTATLPASVTTASLFKVQRAQLNLGPAAAPDISTEKIAFSITVNNNATPRFRCGQAAGEEILPAFAIIGKQRVSGEVTVQLQDTLRAHFTSETAVEIILTLSSDDQVDGADKTITVTLPKVIFSGEAFPLDGSLVGYTFQFNEQSVMRKDGSTAPITVELITDIDDTEILVNSP